MKTSNYIMAAGAAFALTTLSFMTARAAVADEDTGFYMSGNAGLALPENLGIQADFVIQLLPGVQLVPTPDPFIDMEFKTGAHLTGAAGYDFGRFRLEGEVGSIDSAIRLADAPGAIATDTDLLSLMGNAYYDFGGGRLQPYVGGGLGYARLNLGDFRSKKLAWQAMAGARYRLSGRTFVGAEYRYFGTGTEVRLTDFRVSSVLATISYYFN